LLRRFPAIVGIASLTTAVHRTTSRVFPEMADMTATAEFNFMKAVVVKSHTATDETQLELCLGDRVYVLEQDDSGWWGGHKEGEDCTGWFPGSCVRAIEDELPEPGSEPLPSVPEEDGVAAARLLAGTNCEQVVCNYGALDLDTMAEHDALHHGNRMVASPNRRVSGEASSPNRRVSVGTAVAGMHAHETDTAAYSNLQAEFRTLSAIAEDRACEIHRLQAERTEVETVSRQSEEMRRQLQSCEAREMQMQAKMQEMQAQLEAHSAKDHSVASQVSAMRSEVAKAQQEADHFKSEARDFERRFQEKEVELRNVQEAHRQLCTGQASVLSSVSQLAATQKETRRNLFPATLDEAPLMPAGSRGRSTPSFATTDFRSKDIDPVSTNGTVRSNASSADTAPRSQAYRQPSQPPAPAAPASSAPLPRPIGSPSALNRTSSLTRPAFRQLPGVTSPAARSPGGLAKCRSTGDLPPTPKLDQEAPVIGSVKEKMAYFESVLAERAGTPRKNSTEASFQARSMIETSFQGRSMIADTPHSRSMNHLGAFQKSPLEQRCETFRPASNSQAPIGRTQLPALDMTEAGQAVDDPVNFNMSPMRRNQ